MPIAFADQIRDDTAWISNNRSWEAAQDFVDKVAAIDWGLVDELHEEHTTYPELAALCGIPSWYIEKRTRHLRRINPKRTTEPRDV